MATMVDNTIQTTDDENNDDNVTKDLAYFEANPDEMPTDPDAMAALLAGETGARPEEIKGDDIVDDAGTEPGQKTEAETTTDDGDAGKTDEPEADVILLKDGKRAIPYNVLDNTRKEVSTLRGELTEKEQQIAELQAQLDGVKDDGTGSKNAAQEAIDSGNLPTNEDGSLDIEALRADYEDEVVDILVAMEKRANDANNAVQELSKRVDEIASKDEEAQAQTAAEASQAAIDSIPALAEVQSEGGSRWKAAITIDDELRNDPAWAGKPMSERFAEVARQLGLPVTDAENGDIDAGVKKAMQNAKPNTPRSISDLEGGEQIGQDEFERLDNLSAIEFASAFEKMTPEKQQLYLARIG